MHFSIYNRSLKSAPIEIICLLYDCVHDQVQGQLDMDEKSTQEAILRCTTTWGNYHEQRMERAALFQAAVQIIEYNTPIQLHIRPQTQHSRTHHASTDDHRT